MNLTALHTKGKDVSAKSFYKSENGSALSIQLAEGGLFDKHTTPIPAMLLCVSGEVVYEDEKGIHEVLLEGDFIDIVPDVVHWLKGRKASQLVLVK